MGVVIIYAKFNNGTTAGSAKVSAVVGGMATNLGTDNMGMLVNHPTYGFVYKFEVGISYADYSNVKVEVVGNKMGVVVEDEETGITIDAQ